MSLKGKGFPVITSVKIHAKTGVRYEKERIVYLKRDVDDWINKQSNIQDKKVAEFKKRGLDNAKKEAMIINASLICNCEIVSPRYVLTDVDFKEVLGNDAEIKASFKRGEKL